MMTPPAHAIARLHSLTSPPAWTLLVIGLTVVSYTANEAFSLQQSCVLGLMIAGASAAAIGAAVARDSRLLPFAYFLIVFLLFHYGLTPQLALGDGDDVGVLLGFQNTGWLRDEANVKLALINCNLFSAGLVCTLLLASPRVDVSPAGIQTRPSLGWISLGLLAISIFAWLAVVVVVGGVRNYTMYNQFFVASPVGPLIAGFLNVSIAATFLLAAVHMRKPHASLVLYLLWAAVAFPLGVRGSVLLPLALTLPILVARRSIRLPLAPTLVGAFVLLSLIAFVAGSRTGVQTVGAALEQASPMKGLAELGSSLRPVREVNRWLSSGDLLRYGESYWVPLERLFLRIVPVVERIDSRVDTRLMNVLVQQRVGPIGFSVVAEAVINFGMLGALAVGALAGATARRLSYIMVVNSASLLAPALMYALLFHVRQGFAGAFGTFFMFLAILIAVVSFDALIRISATPRVGRASQTARGGSVLQTKARQ